MNTVILILLIIIVVILLCDSNISIQLGSITFGSSSDKENFGAIPNPTMETPNINYLAQQLSTNNAQNIIGSEKNIGDIQNPNYNTSNNIPYLVNDDGTGYYQKRVKIETNPNSELLILANKNKKILSDNISNCKRTRAKYSDIDNIKGYNNWDDLRKESYSKTSGIGKALLTGYSGYPVSS